MAPLLSARDLSKSYGTSTLFAGVRLTIDKGERIGMIGPNGSGKSTLLRILAGEEQPDQGEVVCRRHLVVAYIPQQSMSSNQTLEEILDERLQHARPSMPKHERETLVAIHLSKVGFNDHSVRADTLSGGWRKRLDIARGLVTEPDLLLLDEPTNHLDLEGILWLEAFLLREVATYVVISHDRAFLQSVSAHTIELNRRYANGIFRVEGDYGMFLEKRALLLEGQEKEKAALQGKMRRELEWLRRSPPARTSKSRSRIKGAENLKDELSDLQGRTRERRADITFAATGRQTRKLLVATNLTKRFGDRTLFEGVNITLSPGTRLGLVGVNGTGKSTLMRILAGEETPDAGTRKLAEGVRVVHFDQHREQLPLDTTLRYALSEDGETVYYHGRPIHVSGWAERFLFPKHRLDQQIGKLSGGERARILIARLVLRPSDILLLDEPTNDLDIETLEILEESLEEYPGAVVLITHDRLMLDEVSTELLGLGANSDASRFADYAQWETHRMRLPDSNVAKTQTKPRKQEKPRRLSYHEQRELATMEEAILAAEEELEELRKHSETAEVAGDSEQLLNTYTQMGAVQERIDKLYRRWQELEHVTQDHNGQK